jgi:hypothetical protein
MAWSATLGMRLPGGSTEDPAEGRAAKAAWAAWASEQHMRAHTLCYDHIQYANLLIQAHAARLCGRCGDVHSLEAALAASPYPRAAAAPLPAAQAEHAAMPTCMHAANQTPPTAGAAAAAAAMARQAPAAPGAHGGLL